MERNYDYLNPNLFVGIKKVMLEGETFRMTGFPVKIKKGKVYPKSLKIVILPDYVNTKNPDWWEANYKSSPYQHFWGKIVDIVHSNYSTTIVVEQGNSLDGEIAVPETKERLVPFCATEIIPL